MTNIDIDDKIHKQWVNFYNKQNKLEFPTLKNFTAKTLQKIMKKNGHI